MPGSVQDCISPSAARANQEAILKALEVDICVPSIDVLEMRLSEALLASEDTARVQENAVTFAKLFFRLLVHCQKLLASRGECASDLPAAIQGGLLKLLGNIGQIRLLGQFADDRGGASYLNVIELLDKLRQASDDSRVPDIDTERIALAADGLLTMLGEIDFVFDMVHADGRPVFPIQLVIGNAVERIIRNGHSIGLSEVLILKLAVKFFERPGAPADSGAALDELVGKCNLRFVKFLESGCFMVDDQDCGSFRMNGSMVFWDSRNRHVLVRHASESYFGSCEAYLALSGEQAPDIKHERDRSGGIIGSFVEWELSGDGMPQGIGELVGSVQGVRRLLELLFDCGARNILMMRALAKASDGNVYPINPWCVKDGYIICDAQRGGRRYFEHAKVLEAYAPYRILPAALSQSRPLNWVTFGLCAFLLHVRNVGVSALGLGELREDAWYQEQVLLSWARCEREEGSRLVSVADVREVLGRWQRQTEYCCAASFEQRRFEAIEFLPVKLGSRAVYELLSPGGDSSEKMYFGVVVGEPSGERSVEVVPSRTAERGCEQVSRIAIGCLDDEARLMDEMRQGDDVYFLYSQASGRGRVVDQGASKMLAEVEIIQSGGFVMGLDVGLEVCDVHFGTVAERMALFKAELGEHMDGCVMDGMGFESAVRLRLLHNLIWSGVPRDGVSDYFGVIEHHQILDYVGIENDPLFAEEEQGVLYVPKDRREADSVLRSLFEGPLRARSHRETRDVYCDEVGMLDDGRYCVHGQNVPITRIIVLTDNIMGGSKTKSILRVHFEMEGADGTASAAQAMEYHLEGRTDPVSLKAISERNGAAVMVHAYYATERGIAAVDEFLNAHELKFEATSCTESIYRFVAPIAEKANRIWMDGVDGGCCAVIRAHNMPKMTVFPDAMTDDPSRFICLFVKKSERTWPF